MKKVVFVIGCSNLWFINVVMDVIDVFMLFMMCFWFTYYLYRPSSVLPTIAFYLMHKNEMRRECKGESKRETKGCNSILKCIVKNVYITIADNIFNPLVLMMTLCSNF